MDLATCSTLKRNTMTNHRPCDKHMEKIRGRKQEL